MATSSWIKPLNQLFGATSSYYYGYPLKRSHSNYENIHNPSYHQHTPLQTTTYCGQYSKPPSSTLSRRHNAYHRIKRYLKMVTAFSLVISTLLTLFMESSMIYVLYKFLRTRHSPASDYSRWSPWANHTVIWPTYMLLVSSAMTFFLCFAMLTAVSCRSKKKPIFSMLYNVAHVVVWAVVMVLYRANKTKKDLWGWSCSEKADAIQGLYDGVVPFNSLCQLQTSDWQASVAEVGIKAVCGGVGWYLKTKGSRVRKSIVEDFGDADFEDLF